MSKHSESERAKPADHALPGASMKHWHRAALIASIIIVLILPAYAVKERLLRSPAAGAAADSAAYVGGESCAGCHANEFRKWQHSHHDDAMAVAADSTVLGNFNDAVFEHKGVRSRFYKKDGAYFVNTQGPGGGMGEFEIAYTFGVEPLQQYLVPFPGGRLQALPIAWDCEHGEWFHLYPDQDIPADDWLHWTRNGQNWNGMCAECHSTNLQKGYDPVSKSYSTSWSEIDVGCEACHGPASRHVAWASVLPMARPDIDNYGLMIRTGDIGNRQQVELCAPCHSRRTQFGDYAHSKTGLLENLVPALLTEELYFADGQILGEVYVYGSFVQSKMYRNDVRCSDCHDVHSLQLVREGNDLCIQCHQQDAYDSYDHHFHKKIHEGKPSDGALCVKCHMTERTYMVIDGRADHSLRIPRPDLTQEISTPNACGQSGCHADQSVAWAVDHYTEWYGRARKPHYGRTFAAAREGRPETAAKLIRLATDVLYPAIVRATALSYLQSYPGDESMRTFAAALADEDALVRYTAVQNVVTSTNKELAGLAAPLLFDPLQVVRGQAAVRLSALAAGSLKLYQQTALQAALREYEQSMKYSLDFAFAAHNLGNLYASTGRNEQARNYYRTALEIDDLFYPAKMNLAMLCNRSGDNEQAERLFREVLAAYPDMHETAYSLGLLLVEMDRHAQAEEYLRRAAAGMPNTARVQYNYGLILQYLKRDGEAEDVLRKAVDLDPNSIEYLYALADHYIKRGLFEKALPYADKMIAVRPDLENGHRLRAHIINNMESRGD